MIEQPLVSARVWVLRGCKRRTAEVVEFVRRVVRDDAREHFVALYLDGRHRPIAHQVVSIGTASEAFVHPREGFQPAILVGACAVIVAHNHPSGDLTPSRQDREITQRLAQAGALLGVSLLDGVVFTRSLSTTDHSGSGGNGARLTRRPVARRCQYPDGTLLVRSPSSSAMRLSIFACASTVNASDS